MAAPIDLSLYLDRIGWRGPVAPTLECLAGLTAAHPAAIAFENLNPLLGLPVELTPEALERKMLREGRGGYCFEQNSLFAHALRAIGFRLSGLAARVLWGQAPDAAPGAVPPRTHMLLRVPIDGVDYLADVGFGGQTPTGVLRLEADVIQPTPHEPFRLTRIGGDWLLESLMGGAWQPLYRFDLQEQHPIDYELASYYVSTHPRSPFVTGLKAARAIPGRRLALRDREFAIHHSGGKSERRTLGDATEICATLERDFLLRLPDRAALLARLEQLPA